MPPRRRAQKRRRIDDSACQSSSESPPEPGDDAERFEDPSHAQSLRAGLTRLWKDGRFCDLTLTARRGPGDAAEGATADVRVHSVVAAALSEPLEQMLAGPMASVQGGILALPELDGAVLESVAEFLYTGSFELSAETIWSSLAAASFLGLDGMKGQCCEALGERLEAATVLGVGDASEKFSCVELGAGAAVLAGILLLRRHGLRVGVRKRWPYLVLVKARP